MSTKPNELASPDGAADPIFAVTGRIFMLMVAHAAFDLNALAIIYRDLETDVAHLIFK